MPKTTVSGHKRRGSSCAHFPDHGNSDGRIMAGETCLDAQSRVAFGRGMIYTARKTKVHQYTTFFQSPGVATCLFLCRFPSRPLVL